MAKIKRETTRMKPEINSREGKIGALVAMGLGNAAVWAAMEQEYPQIIETKDDRRNPNNTTYIKGIPPYDKDERSRVSRAINSVRGLAIKEDEETREAVEVVGGNMVQVENVNDIEMQNRHRFSVGEPAMDFIYGTTRFVHPDDAPDSEYVEEVRIHRQRMEDRSIRETKQKVTVWRSGSWRAGDPMIPLSGGKFQHTRNRDGSLIELDMKAQKIENGFPESFLSLWPGEFGVGKTRLAISTGKGINRVTREPILYVNGEATKEDFRLWLGHDVESDLFKVVTAELLPVERIAEFAYQVRPKAIFIDSIQTIAEATKGEGGLRRALTRLKMLKGDPLAGMPHIILISQLNKQGKIKGSNLIPHIVDAVANVRRMENRKGHFIFEITKKNRGGETPRGATFRHIEGGVECISTELIKTPIYKLVQPVSSPALKKGVVDPSPMPQSSAEPAHDNQDVDTVLSAI